MERNALLCLFLLHYLLSVSCNYELTVLHTNDVHAHVEEFNKYGGSCTTDTSTNCYGGVARRHTVVEQIRRSRKNVILLDGGDEFQGTLWFNVYKGQAAALFMNHTRYDAMAVGNHEFDNGNKGLSSFIEAANFSVLSANVDTSEDSTWPNSVTIKKSVIIERSGKKIGVVGYTTQDTAWLSKPGRGMKFSDVVKSVRNEAEILKKKGVNIIIALGHAGIEIDKMVAREVKEVDLVVGGHSNTFLYNGSQLSNDRIEGVYPLKYERSDGSIALVVQDFMYGKYLGKLNLVFDDAGDIKTWNGNPILLNSSYIQDQNILNMVKELEGPILQRRNISVGRTLVHLDGSASSCRMQECNLGNFVTDAIVRMTQQTPDEKKWATVALGIWNGGGIRSSIEKSISEFISGEELNAVLPFGSTADIIEIKGEDLIAAFEHSVSYMPLAAGRFLQVSGFKVKYDLNKPRGCRVVEIKTLCIKCRIPKYEKIVKDNVYKVVTSSYLISGGDMYTMFKNALTHHPGEIAFQLLERYLKQESPIAPAAEGRIEYVGKSNCPSSNKSTCINPSFGIWYLALWYYLFGYGYLSSHK